MGHFASAYAGGDATAAIEPAGRWPRLWASLLDVIILFVPFGVVFIITAVVTSGVDSARNVQLASAIGQIVLAAYTIVLTAKNGQTIGKRALGIRVVRAADGEIPGWRTASFRYLVFAAPTLIRVTLEAIGIPISEWLVSGASTAMILPILFDHLHRGVHDFAAGTVVVPAYAKRVVAGDVAQAGG